MLLALPLVLVVEEGCCSFLLENVTGFASKSLGVEDVDVGEGETGTFSTAFSTGFLSIDGFEVAVVIVVVFDDVVVGDVTVAAVMGSDEVGRGEEKEEEKEEEDVDDDILA